MQTTTMFTPGTAVIYTGDMHPSATQRTHGDRGTVKSVDRDGIATVAWRGHREPTRLAARHLTAR